MSVPVDIVNVSVLDVVLPEPSLAAELSAALSPPSSCVFEEGFRLDGCDTMTVGNSLRKSLVRPPMSASEGCAGSSAHATPAPVSPVRPAAHVRARLVQSAYLSGYCERCTDCAASSTGTDCQFGTLTSSS